MPLRGGSKSIPLKNIKKIAGYPLFYWSLKAALDSDIFEELYISSDSDLILDEVNKYFPEDNIKTVKRDPTLAQDITSTEAVMIDFAKNYTFDVFCLIQATSPLTSSDDFRGAKEMFEKNKLDSLLTGCIFKRFLWDHSGKAINYDPAARPRRQEFKGQLVENGAFYFTTKDILTTKQNRLGGNTGVYPMADDTFFEIDEPSDWVIVEELLKRKNVDNITKNLKNIKALVLDVDGTLTDAGMYYDKEGEALKKFNTRDAHGMVKFREAGGKLCIITAEESPRVHARMEKLKIESKDYFFGIKDKLPTLVKWAKSNNLSLDEIAYGGDDLGDLECLRESGFSFCPNDAVPQVKQVVNYICESKAGDGAVREICNYLLTTC